MGNLGEEAIASGPILKSAPLPTPAIEACIIFQSLWGPAGESDFAQ